MTYQPIDPDSLKSTPYDSLSDEELLANVRYYDDASRPVGLEFRDDKLLITLADGRVIGAPLVWFPILKEATELQRHTFEFSTTGVHWETLNEDILIESLLKGIRPAPPAPQLA